MPYDVKYTTTLDSATLQQAFVDAHGSCSQAAAKLAVKPQDLFDALKAGKLNRRPTAPQMLQLVAPRKIEPTSQQYSAWRYRFVERLTVSSAITHGLDTLRCIRSLKHRDAPYSEERMLTCLADAMGQAVIYSASPLRLDASADQTRVDRVAEAVVDELIARDEVPSAEVFIARTIEQFETIMLRR